MTTTVPARLTPESRELTAAQFQGLAEVPPELEWFANIRNTRTWTVSVLAHDIGCRPSMASRRPLPQ